MYIKQQQLKNLKTALKPGKVVVIYGARRAGKTRLPQEFLKTQTSPFLLVTGEDLDVNASLSSGSLEKLKLFVGKHRLVVIDEAQKSLNIGMNLKLMVDAIPGLRLIATGSSSFDLAGSVGEPLTGHKTTLLQFPLAQLEIAGVALRLPRGRVASDQSRQLPRFHHGKSLTGRAPVP